MYAFWALSKWASTILTTWVYNSNNSIDNRMKFTVSFGCCFNDIKKNTGIYNYTHTLWRITEKHLFSRTKLHLSSNIKLLLEFHHLWWDNLTVTAFGIKKCFLRVYNFQYAGLYRTPWMMLSNQIPQTNIHWI